MPDARRWQDRRKPPAVMPRENGLNNPCFNVFSCVSPYPRYESAIGVEKGSCLHHLNDSEKPGNAVILEVHPLAVPVPFQTLRRGGERFAWPVRPHSCRRLSLASENRKYITVVPL
jgi:hypothetical protein